MDQDHTHIVESLQKADGEHVFYYFQDTERYVQNAVTYIAAGIEKGEHIILIENDRIYPMIQKKLDRLLTKEELSKVHFINNFDFYCRNGNFYPPTILDYFSEIAKPYVQNNVSIRSWGHIEWGDQKEIDRTLEEYEKATTQMLKEIKVTTICAYNSTRVPETLKAVLMGFHDFFMTDQDFVPIHP